jgi:hypothetical protein
VALCAIARDIAAGVAAGGTVWVMLVRRPTSGAPSGEVCAVHRPESVEIIREGRFGERESIEPAQEGAHCAPA